MKYIFQKAIFALAVSFFYALFTLSAQIRITGQRRVYASCHSLRRK